MIFHDHLRAAAGRFCSILRGFPAPQGRMRTAFYKSLRRRAKHIKLEEIAPPGCYDIDSKTERHPPSCKTLTINQFIIKFQKRSVSSCCSRSLLWLSSLQKCTSPAKRPTRPCPTARTTITAELIPFPFLLFLFQQRPFRLPPEGALRFSANKKAAQVQKPVRPVCVSVYFFLRRPLAPSFGSFCETM